MDTVAVEGVSTEGSSGLDARAKRAAYDRARKVANKEIIAAQYKAYREANKERIAAYKREYAQANKDKIAEWMKAYRAANKAALKAQTDAWRAANREKVRAADNAHYAATKEHHATLRKAHYKANKKTYSARSRAYRLAHAEQIRAIHKAYYEAHKEEFRAHRVTRRARKKGAIGRHTMSDIRNLFNLQQEKCAICGTSISTGYHVDHIYPLVSGGSNDKYNLQLLCAPCNLSKHDKDPIVFMQELGFLL